MNTLLQPAYAVTRPPTVVPATLAKPPNIITSPAAFPRCLSPKAEIAITNAVPCTIAPPIPCIALPDINISIEGDSALVIPPKRNTISPDTMIFLLPNMSVNRPIGNSKVATISKNVVFIHCAVGISDTNSSAIFGNMTFEAPRSRVELIMATAATEKASQVEEVPILDFLYEAVFKEITF